MSCGFRTCDHGRIISFLSIARAANERKRFQWRGLLRRTRPRPLACLSPSKGCVNIAHAARFRIHIWPHLDLGKINSAKASISVGPLSFYLTWPRSIEMRPTCPILRTLWRSSLSLALSDSSLVSILRSCEEARCSEGRSAGWEQIMSSRKSIAMFFSAGLLSKSCKTFNNTILNVVNYGFTMHFAIS